MAREMAQAIRRDENLHKILQQNKILLKERSTDVDAIYTSIKNELLDEFDHNYSEIIDYVKVKLDWPLSFKCSLLTHIQQTEVDNTNLNNVLNFALNPTLSFKRNRRTRLYYSLVSSIERKYGAAVGTVFSLHYHLFLMNVCALIIWISILIIPYKVLSNSMSSSNATFSFSSLFTTKGYLSESLLFQGSYPNEIIDDKYNLPLSYLLTTYAFFIVWVVYITIKFARAYQQKILNSVRSSKLCVSFLCTFARCDYAINDRKESKRQQQAFQRQYLDICGNDEMDKNKSNVDYKNFGYRLRRIVTNLFHIVLAIGLGGINAVILLLCKQPTVDCHGSIIYMALVNRIVPYLIVGLTQIETYKYISYKLDVVTLRCVFTYVCTTLSFTIYFFQNPPSCYETAYGQYIYLLLLSDMFASLVFPLLFGIIFDLIFSKIKPEIDGINVHVQLSSSALLYSQYLIWLGSYFSPLLSLMILLNIIFSFISHRLYLFIRSYRDNSTKTIVVWNATRLQSVIHIVAYILTIISITCFIVFSTQIKPSDNCGPFRQYNASYQVIEEILRSDNTSVLGISLLNFLTSPGFVYFLGATIFVIIYKLRNEGLAEKQLVFIRKKSLGYETNLREERIKRLYE